MENSFFKNNPDLLDKSIPEESRRDSFVNLFNKEFAGIRVEYYPEDFWELVTIHLPGASITISKEIKKFTKDEVGELLSDIKKYRDNVRADNKYDIYGIGGGGSVYVLSPKFVIKESNYLEVENQAIENSNGLQKVIDSSTSFPEDIKLLHAVALIEPPFKRKDIYSKKKYTSPSFDYDTVYGELDDKKVSRVEAYLIMPFLRDTITLEDLLSEKGRDFLNRLIELKVIENDDEKSVKSFLEQQRFRFIQSFKTAQIDVSSYDTVSLQDSSPRNILLRFEDGKPVYYKIDHCL